MTSLLNLEPPNPIVDHGVSSSYGVLQKTYVDPEPLYPVAPSIIGCSDWLWFVGLCDFQFGYIHVLGYPRR